MAITGILYLKNPTGELFEGVLTVPSDGQTYERRVNRDGKKGSIRVHLASDSPDQFRCSVGRKKNKILFEFKKLLAIEEVTNVILGRNLWTGRYTKWSASFEKL